MPEAGETGSAEDMFHCPKCGNLFPTDDKKEAECPVCGTKCTRDKCKVQGASNVGF